MAPVQSDFDLVYDSNMGMPEMQLLPGLFYYSFTLKDSVPTSYLLNFKIRV
jgi:hypothetical protein